MTATQPQTQTVTLTHTSRLYPELHAAGEAGLPVLLVDNALGRAVIALQGAHVLAFRPREQREMLWLSPKCKLQPGTAIRGGIPLCLPWFGPGPDGKTMHGFARVKEWTIAAVERLTSGATRVTLELVGDETTNALWPHAFAFRLEIETGNTLTMSLRVENRGITPAPLAVAFHTYFAVPDVAQARVAGLEGTTYIDKMDNFLKKQQAGEVTIDSVTDRIYLDVPKRQTISAGTTRIGIESESKCAVVWNAWSNDKNIPDLGEGNHVGYLCVERGDVADHALTLAPEAIYTTWMTLSA